MSKRTSAERFFGGVQFTNSCWLWTFCKTPSGYGQFWRSGKIVYAHRYVYELCVAPIPEGLTIDHLCRVKNCVNPDHLEAVSYQVNVLRSPIAPAAINARKTHCIRGHEFTEENTSVELGRWRRRRCKACRKLNAIARKG